MRLEPRGTKMKTASSDRKKRLFTQKTELFKAAANRTTEERKKAGAEAKALYTRMYAKFCTATKMTSEPACSNELMKKMYGGK